MGVSDVYTYLVAYLNSSGLICNKVLAIVTAGIFFRPQQKLKLLTYGQNSSQKLNVLEALSSSLNNSSKKNQIQGLAGACLFRAYPSDVEKIKSPNYLQRV